MTLGMNANDWGLIGIKHSVQNADTFSWWRRGGVDLAHSDILAAVVVSPQGTTQMTPPRHRPEEKHWLHSVNELMLWRRDMFQDFWGAFPHLRQTVGVHFTTLAERSVAECESSVLAHVPVHCVQPSPAFCAFGKRRGRRRRRGALYDSISRLWTTAVPFLQRPMLSVLPLWFRLRSKQETRRLTNTTAAAWTSQTCTTTRLLKCTTALSPGKWKVNWFVGAKLHYNRLQLFQWCIL